MAYEVIVTEVFRDWYEDLAEPEQDSVGYVVDLLQEAGPALAHPYSSGINRSRFSHMRELRIQHKGRPFRVLYAFDQFVGRCSSSAATRQATIDGTTRRSQRCALRRSSQGSETIGAGKPAPQLSIGVQAMAIKWSDLKHKSSPERLAARRQEAREELARIGFDKLRQARQQTQIAVAQRLKIPQGAVSRMEKRSDLLLSTLREYVNALGGRLELRAVFPDADFEIEPLAPVKAPPVKATRKRPDRVVRPAAKRVTGGRG